MNRVTGPSLKTSVQSGLVKGLEATRLMFDHTSAMSDVLQIFIRTFDLAGHIGNFPRVRPFVKAFSQVVDVTSVFQFRNRLKSVCTGKALEDNPSGEGPNWVKFSSKMFLLASDGCTIVDWMSRLGTFRSRIHLAMASIRVFGKQVQFNVLLNVSDGTSVVGSALSAINTIREGKAKGYTAARKVNLTYDINSIAGTLISRVPSISSRIPATPFVIFGTVSLLVGNVLSLTSFLLSKHRDK